MSKLTSAELDVMRVLWEHGEMKPAEIQERYPRSIKNAALRFQLRVLLEKGHVKRRKVGKAYVYQAVTSRNGTFLGMARQMADIFCKGSAVELVAHLVKAEKLSEKDIKEIRKFIADKSRKDE